MNDVLLRLLRAARGAGVRISVAEAIDGFNVADAVGFADRTLLKDSLSPTLAKTVEEKELFERTFDRYFSRDGKLTGVVGAGRAGAVMKMRKTVAEAPPIADLLQKS